MNDIRQAIESLKQPLERAFHNPADTDSLGELEKLIQVTVDRLVGSHKFRFAVQMLLFNLRHELRGFERFDTANRLVVIESTRRLLGELEVQVERGEEIFLRESEIAEEMKAQVAREVEHERLRRATQRPAKEMPRPAPPERRAPQAEEPHAVARPEPNAPPAKGPDEEEASREAAPGGGGPRRRRRPRRKRKPAPQA